MLTTPTTNLKPSLYYRILTNYKLQEFVLTKSAGNLWGKGYFAAVSFSNIPLIVYLKLLFPWQYCNKSDKYYNCFYYMRNVSL